MKIEGFCKEIYKGNPKRHTIFRMSPKLRNVSEQISQIRGISLSRFIRESLYENIKKYSYLLEKSVTKKQ